MSTPAAATTGHTHLGKGRPVIPLHLILLFVLFVLFVLLVLYVSFVFFVLFWDEDPASVAPAENAFRQELPAPSSLALASSIAVVGVDAVLVGSTGTRNIIGSTPNGHVALLPFRGRSRSILQNFFFTSE
jgi:hypothetical protein